MKKIIRVVEQERLRRENPPEPYKAPFMHRMFEAIHLLVFFAVPLATAIGGWYCAVYGATMAILTFGWVLGLGMIIAATAAFIGIAILMLWGFVALLEVMFRGF
jgi:hypothetical protein